MEVEAENSSKREPLYIESHPVYFPHDSYQSQKMVIIKVLQGLRNGRNCLIESPTGSGKTLALLCSCLAWQKKKKELYEAQMAKLMQEMQAKDREFEEQLHSYSYVPRHNSALANSTQASTNAATPPKHQYSSPVAQRCGQANQCLGSPCQPRAVPASKLTITANNITGVNSTSSTSGVVASGVTLDATRVNSAADCVVSRVDKPSCSQPAVVANQFSVSASQSSVLASPPPQLPTALASRLPVHLGGLLQTPPKPGTKYIVVQNNTGQALDLNTLLSLPELRTSKQTVIIQTMPARPHAAGEPEKPAPIRSLVQPPMGNDDDDFQPSKKMRQSLSVPVQTNVASSPNQKGLPKSNATAAVTSATSQQCQQPQPCCSALHATPSKGQQGIADKPLEKVPTIYYGTRTHKQIAQVVRELRKTDYRHTRMAILSSRERTCIDQRVSRSSNKNELCKELIEDTGCRFYTNLKRVPQYPTANFEPYDLEDLVRSGKTRKLCPYYWSLDLAPSADIIFCPYNYLIDPVIRQCMSIDLTDAVVVLDEAHNIEDISREVMSFTVTHDQLRDIIKDLEEMQHLQVLPDEHCAIARVMSKLSVWITQHSDHLNDYKRFEESGKVWAGNEILAFMTDVGLSPESFKAFKHTVATITAVEKEQQQDPEAYRPAVTAATSSTLQNLVIILEFMYGNELRYLGDFRAAMVRSPSRNKQTELSKWTSGGGLNASWTHSLSFWCLNPAVAMSDIKDKVHSLIVASGTLTPMESFESELDMPFKSQLQANHVIPPEGVWVGGIGCGPNNVNLTANFKTAETFEFQDEIGLILFDICRAVPNGVLCFFPSYSMMNKLSQRWQNTGMWHQLGGLKHIAVEPQKADSNTFDETMSEYFRHASGEYGDCDDTGGALLLAVCRGKVSEGLDFADNKARAVVTVGIPFPNVKDMQVDLKRKYNDQQSRSGRPVMGGNAWYETQAFRALNQALGRCIRHRDDWGALIIIDYRFSQQAKFRKALSKWIREQFQCFQYYNEAIDSLKSFMSSKTSTARNFPSSGHKGN